MNKEEFIQKVITQLTTIEMGLVYDIEAKDVFFEDDNFYGEFHYQVDDRVERNDDEVTQQLEFNLGVGFYASVDRKDAFPNGYAYYVVTIETDL